MYGKQLIRGLNVARGGTTNTLVYNRLKPLSLSWFAFLFTQPIWSPNNVWRPAQSEGSTAVHAGKNRKYILKWHLLRPKPPPTQKNTTKMLKGTPQYARMSKTHFPKYAVYPAAKQTYLSGPSMYCSISSPHRTPANQVLLMYSQKPLFFDQSDDSLLIPWSEKIDQAENCGHIFHFPLVTPMSVDRNCRCCRDGLFPTPGTHNLLLVRRRRRRCGSSSSSCSYS